MSKQNIKKTKLDLIEKALKTSYYDKDNIVVANGWQSEVMREIRKTHFSGPEPAPFRCMGKLAWRLMPVTCTLLLLVCAGLLTTDFDPEYELAAMYINSPLDYDFLMGLNLM